MATLALSLTGVGCGDDGPKAQFVERADAICRAARDRTRALDDAKTQKELDRVIEASAAYAQRAVRKLRKVDVPREHRPQIETMFRNIQKTLRLLPALQEANARQDRRTAQRLEVRMSEAINEVQRIAADYGFEECGYLGVGPAE